MKLPAFFRAKDSATAVVGAGAPPAGGTPAGREERRHPAYRCDGCHAWRPPTLVYMSNGGDYCPRCARAIHAWSGAKPAGRRFDDVVSLDEADAALAESLPLG